MDKTLNLQRPPLILALGLLPFLVFWPLTVGLSTLARGDFLEQNYPLRLYAARTWAGGALPFWDPHINGGQPSLADFLTCALYPPNVLTELLSLPWGFPPRALELEVLVHLSMAGIFTFLYAREILDSDLGAFVAGIIFALGGYATSYPMEQNHILESAVWLPLILLFIERAFRRGNLLYYVGAGLWLGICLLAGHPQTALYMVFCFGFYWLWHFLTCRRWGHVLGMVYLAVTALAVSLPQLLPFLELASLSTRATMAYSTSAAGLAPRELWALLAPVHAGNSGLYVSLAALVLAPLGMALPRRRQILACWAAMAILAVVFALGDRGPLYPIMHDLVPGLGLVRQQERMLVVFSLAMAILAGAGITALLDSPQARRVAAVGLILASLCSAILAFQQRALPEPVLNVLPRILAILGLTAAALLWLAARTRRALAAGLLTALILADLWTAPVHTALADNRPAQTPSADAVTALLQKAALEGPAFRVSSEGLLPGDGNAGIFFGLEDLVGSTPMMLTTFYDLIQDVPEFTWWHLANVRYVLTRRTLTHGALALVQDRGDARLYELYGRLPRAWMVHQASTVASPAQARQALQDPSFPADLRAVVENGPAVSSPAQPQPVSITRLTAGSMRLQARADAPGYLLISQNYYPGWFALVDGRLAPVYRANGWQPAIYLTPGSHSVTFQYVPLPFLAGLLFSLTCVVALLLALRRWPAVVPSP